MQQKKRKEKTLIHLDTHTHSFIVHSTQSTHTHICNVYDYYYHNTTII